MGLFFGCYLVISQIVKLKLWANEMTCCKNNSGIKLLLNEKDRYKNYKNFPQKH